MRSRLGFSGWYAPSAAERFRREQVKVSLWWTPSATFGPDKAR